MPDAVLRAEYAGVIRWSRRGSCGNPGCTDPLCCCSVCGEPIGVAEDDPRWETHGGYNPCDDPECHLCEDLIPLYLFRGEGKQMEQAVFHQRCLEKVVWFRAK